MLLDLLGLDLESQAKAETGELNKTRDDMDWDLGDMFRSAVTGVSKQDVIDEAAAMVTEQINNKNSGTIGTILDQTGGTKLGLTNEGLQIQAGETETAYNQRLGRQSRLGTAIVEATASTPGFDPSSIEAGATPSSVLGSARKITDRKADEKTKKAEDLLETQRQDRLTQQNTANAQNERAQAFREHESSENRKERAHNAKMARLERADQRADRKSELLMNREMKMLDRQYMRERDERAEARADKARKQQSIMMLVKGLTNLGQGFAL